MAQTTPATQTEQGQNAPTGVHSTIDWAQTKLVEIDATITALEADAQNLEDDLRIRADAALEALKATRDAYRAQIEVAIADANERTQAQIDQSRTDLEARWLSFENEIEAYFAAANSEFETRRAVLLARVEAQRLAWDEAIVGLQAAANGLAQEQQAVVTSQIEELKARVVQGQDRLARLSQAGDQAWSVFLSGLDEARDVASNTYRDIFDTIDDAIK